MIATLLRLAALFGFLSMLAVGGGAGIIPDMQRAVVDRYQWMSATQFLDMFAISRAAPGPGSLIVVLIGLKVAGLLGAAVSFLAMFAPSCLAVHAIARTWHNAARSRWRPVLERALGPVAVGLTFASGLALMRGTEHEWTAWTVTGVSTLLFSFTEINPVVLLIAGGSIMLLIG
ncbi:chromate transporter [Rhodopila sp.]|uniref:chromate transporter n=1 Tax=Rhodopila sp. TaxID=2480087 RepID=UPI002C93DA29|nr:chromate transporter [Rhodopila sp.]HVZ10175.1 chromate transporter [Rhodopila sp.]